MTLILVLIFAAVVFAVVMDLTDRGRTPPVIRPTDRRAGGHSAGTWAAGAYFGGGHMDGGSGWSGGSGGGSCGDGGAGATGGGCVWFAECRQAGDLRTRLPSWMLTACGDAWC